MQTITFYNENVKTFIGTYLNIDCSPIQNIFLGKLHKESFILDFGCGLAGTQSVLWFKATR